MAISLAQWLGQPARRRRSISYSAMPAATPAFSDSVVAAIGIRTSTSHVSLTSRDRPLPSLPTTSTSGSVGELEVGEVDVALGVEAGHHQARPPGTP